MPSSGFSLQSVSNPLPKAQVMWLLSVLALSPLTHTSIPSTWILGCSSNNPRFLAFALYLKCFSLTFTWVSPPLPPGLSLRKAFPELSDTAYPLFYAYKPALTHPLSFPHSNGHSGLASQLALVCLPL